MEKGNYSVKGKEGAILRIVDFRKIPRDRCLCPGAHRAVIIGLVVDGSFKPNDKIVIEGPSGKELIEDIVGRLEINRQKQDEVFKGKSVGMLLMESSPEDLSKLGLPFHRPGSLYSAMHL